MWFIIVLIINGIITANVFSKTVNLFMWLIKKSLFEKCCLINKAEDITIMESYFSSNNFLNKSDW